MNTKGIKFLAVLAVLAMAFVSFAVAVDTGSAEAAATGDKPIQTDEIAADALTVTNNAVTLSGVGPYYLDMTSSSVSGDVTVDVNGNAATIYVLPSTSYKIIVKTTNATPAALTLAVAKSFDSTGGKVTAYTNLTVSVTPTNSATGSATVVLATGTTATGPTAKITTTDATITDAIFGAKFVDSAGDGKGTYYWAQGATISDITLESGDSALIKEAKVTVKQAGTTTAAPFSGSITFAGTMASTDGITLTYAGDGMTVGGTLTTVDADHPIIIKGRMKTSGEFIFSDEEVPSIAAGTNGAFSSNKFASGVYLIGSDYKWDLAGTRYVYGPMDMTFDLSKGQNALNLVNSTGTIKMEGSEGNLVISTVKLTGTITPVNAKGLSATVVSVGGDGQSLTYKEGTFTSGSTSFTGDLTVASDAIVTYSALATMAGDLLVRGELRIDENLALTGNGSIYGILKGVTKNETITVNSKSDSSAGAVVFKAFSGSEIIGVVLEKGDYEKYITIDLSGATSIAYLHGVVVENMDFGQTQTVIVDADLEIKGEAVINILGSFEVSEGVKMTITNGTVNVNGAGVDVKIDGILTVDEKGIFAVGEKAKSVAINGTLVSEGTLSLGTKDVTVAKGGLLKIDDSAVASTITAVTIAAGGEMDILGKIGASTITNKGAILMDGAIMTGNVEIDMAANLATIQVKSVMSNGTNYTFTITDKDMTVSKHTPYYDNIITWESGTTAERGIGGFTVMQLVVTAKYNNVDYFYSSFTLAGEIGVIGGTDKAYSVTLNTVTSGVASIGFADEFTISAGITLNAATEVTVDYDMYVIGNTSQNALLTGSVVVNGIIAVNSYHGAMDGAGFSAVSFSIGTGVLKMDYYTSIANALEVLEDYTENISLKVLGTKSVVTGTVTYPANISLKGEGAFKVGTYTDNTAVMYMTEGATIGSDITITVYGTLYLENGKDIKTTKVTADVTTTDGKDLSFTNLYTALSTADAGDIVEITTDNLSISKSIVVPEGVVLYIPSGITAKVTASEKITVTVNGTIMAADGIGVEGGTWGTTLSETVAVLKVNGLFMTDEKGKDLEGVYGVYCTPGAYYYISDSIGDFVYIGSLSDALETSVKAISIYGEFSDGAEMTAKGSTTTDVVITVQDGAKLKVADLTLERATIRTLGTGTVSGQISGTALDDTNSTIIVNKYQGTVSDIYDSTDKIFVFSINSITGTVVIESGLVTAAADITAVAGTEFEVGSDATFNIPYERTVTLTGDYLIDGTVLAFGTLVLNNKDSAITGIVSVMHDLLETEFGTLTINALTTVTGSIMALDGTAFNVNANVIVGIESDLSAVGTIAGDVTNMDDSCFILVFPGADVSEMTIEADTDGESTAKVTEFYINDELYMTAYASSTTSALVKNVIAIPDYDMEEYVTKDLKTTTTWGATDATKVGAFAILEATIPFATVEIKVSAVPGLALYIDGVKMLSDKYTLDVGVHTVSATINAGYACDNMKITFDGVVVPVTKDGTLITIGIDDKDSVLAVTGDVYIPEPEPVTPEEKSEWTITTILLVVLVILIAVMAVIVALRLNRS